MKITSQLAYIAFAAVCFFWGTTYFAIKIGVNQMEPLAFSGLRHIIAGAFILLYFIGFRKQAFPTKRQYIQFSIAGFLLVFMANVLICYSELYIDSGLAALLCALLPFYILIINQVLGLSEQISFRKIVGLFCGLSGLLMISWRSGEQHNVDFWKGVLFTLLANVAWALGTIYVKEYSKSQQVSPFYAAGWQMMIAGLASSILALFLGQFEHLADLSVYTWSSLFYLVFFGSILGFGSYTYAITHLPVTLVSLHVYVNPIVALLLGYLLLNEPLTWQIFPAALLTLLGIYLVNK